MQLEALASDGQRLTAWPSSSSTREAKRLTHGRLRGAYLQLLAVWHGPEAFVFRLGRPFRVFRDALKGWNHFLKCSGTKTLDRSNNLPTVVGPEPSVWNHGFSMRASSGLLYSIARWLRRGSGCGNIEIAHRYERHAGFCCAPDLLCDDFSQIKWAGQDLVQIESIHTYDTLAASKCVQSVLCEAALADDKAAGPTGLVLNLGVEPKPP